MLAADGRSFCAGADFSKRMDTGTVSEGSRSAAGRHLYKEAIRLFRTGNRSLAPCMAQRSAAGSASLWFPIFA